MLKADYKLLQCISVMNQQTVHSLRWERILMIAVFIWLTSGMQQRFSRWEKMSEGSCRCGNSTLVPKLSFYSGEPPYSILTVNQNITNYKCPSILSSYHSAPPRISRIPAARFAVHRLESGEIIFITRLMLSRRKELEFRARRQQLEGSIAGWCGLPTAIPSPPKSICGLKSPKHKISIKHYRSNQGHRYSKSQPLNIFTQPSVSDVAGTPKQNGKIGNKVNFTFSYGRSCSYLERYSKQTKLPTQSTKSIIMPEQYTRNAYKLPSQEAKLSRHASVCYIPQQEQPSQSQYTYVITGIEQENDNEGAEEVSRLEQTSMLAHPDGEEEERWEGSTPNKVDGEESKKGLDDYRFFARPQIKNFQRGDLFSAVRRSQTIKDDYESESETSQVLQDYKSLMSKIQQNGIQEQFQQI